MDVVRDRLLIRLRLHPVLHRLSDRVSLHGRVVQCPFRVGRRLARGIALSVIQKASRGRIRFGLAASISETGGHRVVRRGVRQRRRLVDLKSIGCFGHVTLLAAPSSTINSREPQVLLSFLAVPGSALSQNHLKGLSYETQILSLDRLGESHSSGKRHRLCGDRCPCHCHCCHRFLDGAQQKKGRRMLRLPSQPNVRHALG